MVLHPAWLSESEADHLLAVFLEHVPWRQDHLTLFGKRHPVPRRHCWFADDGATYRWSGLTMEPAPWLPDLLALRERLEDELPAGFPFLLANLYRDGDDAMGWHADDEPELGPRPLLASISLGATRDFALRENTSRTRTTIPLPHGSLLLLDGRLQETHQHSLPRRKRVRAPRVNLSFRGQPR